MDGDREAIEPVHRANKFAAKTARAADAANGRFLLAGDVLAWSMIEEHQTLIARYPVPIDDGRGFLPDRISASAPVGMRDDIKRAARAAGVTVAAFIRDAVAERLRQVAVEQGPR